MIEGRYTLQLNEFKMYLDAAEVGNLLPHEETIPELLEKLTCQIERDGIIKHPIIADHSSLVVLDGNHRVEAMRRLGYSFIPVCTVDYSNPLIEVKCWYRTIEGRDYQALIGALDDFNPIKDPEMVDRKNSLTVVARKGVLASEPHNNLQETYEALRRLEARMRNAGFSIGYSTEESACKSVQEGSAWAYVAMPPLTKDIIVEVGRSGRRFPCKTSRHIFPARPMGIDFPLSFLKGYSMDETRKQLYLWLSKRHVSQIPPRTVFEGRQYDESLFLFQEYGTRYGSH